MEIVNLSRDVKTIVKFVNSSEGNVRQAALHPSAEMFKSLGDSIWTYIGEIAPKARDLLD